MEKVREHIHRNFRKLGMKEKKEECVFSPHSDKFDERSECMDALVENIRNHTIESSVILFVMKMVAISRGSMGPKQAKTV